MLVQTSMAHAFTRMSITNTQLRNATNAQLSKWHAVHSKVEGALRAKIGTIKVDDKINLTRRTFLQLREQGNLPAYMMAATQHP